MSTFGLNDDYDIFLEGSTLKFITGADAVVQKLETLLRTYRGEWWLDLLSGVPWFQEILTSPADIANAERILKQVILSPTGVESIISFTATFNAVTRDMSINFEVDTIYGPSGPVEVTV